MSVRAAGEVLGPPTPDLDGDWFVMVGLVCPEGGEESKSDNGEGRGWLTLS